jgi:hypothetical protein
VAEERARPARARRRASAAKRRRTILGLLLASMALSFVPVVAVGGKTALVVHLAVDNCFLVYLALLVRWRDSRSGRPAGRAAHPPRASVWDDEDDDALVVTAPRVRAAFPVG